MFLLTAPQSTRNRLVGALWDVATPVLNQSSAVAREYFSSSFPPFFFCPNRRPFSSAKWLSSSARYGFTGFLPGFTDVSLFLLVPSKCIRFAIVDWNESKPVASIAQPEKGARPKRARGAREYCNSLDSLRFFCSLKKKTNKQTTQ